MPTRRKSRKSRKSIKSKWRKATYRSRKKKIRAGMIGLPRVERVKKLFCDPVTHKFFKSPVILPLLYPFKNGFGFLYFYGDGKDERRRTAF